MEETTQPTAAEREKQVRSLFFAYRNGIVADTLRKAGLPHKTIFGLNVPQLAAIAKPLMPDHELALRLWGDPACREARLLACWLFDPALTDADLLRSLAASLQCREEADILAFRQLRPLPEDDPRAELLAAAMTEAGYPPR